MRPERGFTLLEAIVALAVLAAAGLALFAATSQAMQMVGRAESARRLDAASRDALARLEAIDVVAESRGRFEAGGFDAEWRAEPVEPPRPNSTGFLEPGLYEVGLYAVRLELREAGRIERTLDVRRAGWRQVREPVAP